MFRIPTFSKNSGSLCTLVWVHDLLITANTDVGVAQAHDVWVCLNSCKQIDFQSLGTFAFCQLCFATAIEFSLCKPTIHNVLSKKHTLLLMLASFACFISKPRLTDVFAKHMVLLF